MKLNQKQFGLGLRVIASSTNRMVMFSLYQDKTLTYSEIKTKIEKYNNWENKKSGKSAYYIRKLISQKIIRKEQRYYFLTRFGLQLCELVKGIESICMEYDMSDVDEDGKIIIRVKR